MNVRAELFQKWGIIGLAFFIGITLFVLNHFYPFIHDDYAYSFFFDENSGIIRPTCQRISSFTDILISQWNHYQFVNGRFPTHVFVQLFAGLWGKGIFNICNTFVFILFCVYFSRLVVNKISVLFLWIPFILLFFDLPFPGQTIFWMAGAVNYLWATAFSLVVLVQFICVPSRSGMYPIILWSLFAFLVGWMNESVSIPIAGGLFLYGVFNHKRLSLRQKMILMAYCVGCALIVFSPGTTARLEHSDEIQVTNSIVSFFFTRTWNLFLFYLRHPISFITLLMILYALVSKKDSLRSFYKQESLYIFLLLFSILFLWGVNMPDERIFFFYEVLSWIILLRFLQYTSIRWQGRKMYIVYGLFICLSVLGISRAFKSIKTYHVYNEVVIAQIKQASSEAILPSVPYPGKEDAFVYVTPLSDDPTNYHNRVKSFYYGKKFIVALPPKIYEEIISSNSIEMFPDGLKKNTEIFGVKSIDNKYLLFNTKQLGIETVKITQVQKNFEYNRLTSRQIFLRKLFGSYNNDSLIREQSDKVIFSHGGSRYFFIEDNNADSVKIHCNNGLYQNIYLRKE